MPDRKRKLELRLSIDQTMLVATGDNVEFGMPCSQAVGDDLEKWFNRMEDYLRGRTMPAVTADGLLQAHILEKMRTIPRPMTLDEIISFVNVPRDQPGWQERIAGTVGQMVVDGLLTCDNTRSTHFYRIQELNHGK